MRCGAVRCGYDPKGGLLFWICLALLWFDLISFDFISILYGERLLRMLLFSILLLSKCLSNYHEIDLSGFPHLL
jgi:hypothetical protein